MAKNYEKSSVHDLNFVLKIANFAVFTWFCTDFCRIMPPYSQFYSMSTFYIKKLFLILELTIIGPIIILLKLNWTLLFFGLLLLAFVSLFLICKGLDFTFMDWANGQSRNWQRSTGKGYRSWYHYGSGSRYIGFNGTFIPYFGYVPGCITSRISVKMIFKYIFESR